MKIVELENGKYKIHIDDNNIMQKVTRYDEEWLEAPICIPGANCWHALLWRMLEAEEKLAHLEELQNV